MIIYINNLQKENEKNINKKCFNVVSNENRKPPKTGGFLFT